jgi:hypothetical protein
MRLSHAALFALLAAWPAAGCLSTRPGAEATVTARRMSESPGPDVVRIDVAVIQRPAGDRYLNFALWEPADEQTVDFERKPALDDNGLRVGLIGGMVPADLLAMLTSDKSCAAPHRLQVRGGQPIPLALGNERAHCRYTLYQGERAVPVQLDNAVCEFEVVPTPADDGRVTLRFTPQVKHGLARREPRAVRDRSGERRWDMVSEQPTETYENLSWEITVAPDEYVVVGTRLDRDDSLGRCFFLDTESARPTQRLLVIRAGRASSGATPDEAAPGDSVTPLALQASWRTVRGAAPDGGAGRLFP